MVFKTSEEVDHESALATQESLVELGKVLQEKQQKIEVFNKLYNQLEEEYKNFLHFNIDQIAPNFNIQTYLSEINDGSSNKFLIDNDKYKLFILREMTKHKLEEKNDKIIELNKTIDDMNEQSDEYLDQIENIEKDNLQERNKLALRITNLRSKCIYKNKLIFWQEVFLFIFAYIAILSPTRVYYQISIIYDIFYQIMDFILYGFIFLTSYILDFMIYYNLLPLTIGVILGSLGILYFFNYKQKKELNKIKDHIE